MKIGLSLAMKGKKYVDNNSCYSNAAICIQRHNHHAEWRDGG
jgi:hypothetical protein